MSVRVGSSATSSPFPKAAPAALDNSQLRRNVKHATDIIQLKRKNMTGELPDWEELRTAGHAIKKPYAAISGCLPGGVRKEFHGQWRGCALGARCR